MPGSWGFFKEDIYEYLTKNYDKNSTVLDVGCGQADYYNLLKDYFNKIDAVEVFEPYIREFSLKEKYNNVYNVNILDFQFEHYDIIIMGDVLEHIERKDASELIKKLSKKCNELIITVPYNLHQGVVNDNTYEVHLQPDLNDEIMSKYYPIFELLKINGKELKARIDVGENVYYYCVYKKRKEKNVILTLSTIPNRLSKQYNNSVEWVINFLCNLTYKNYEIHFNIPYINNKTGETYIIPEWLNNIKSDKLKIYRTEDYGSLTKLLPTIERINDPETVIITLDDDLEYQDGFIEYHLMKRVEYPHAALGFAGIASIPNDICHFCTPVKQDTRVKILEGYKTVSYLRKFFKEDFREFSVGNWNDDLIISAYLGKENIIKIVMNYEKETDFNPRAESFPVIRSLPNEFGGCNLYRIENLPDNNEIYYKKGWLER